MPSSFCKCNNPTVRRMAEDMLLRNMAVRTIDSYTYRTKFIALCRRLCPPQLPVEEENQLGPGDNTKATDSQTPSCPKCHQPTQQISDTRRPAWRDLFYGSDHPAWFES